MTKIFCDIADIRLIKKFDKKKIVKGFTTNPSLIRKAGAKNYTNYCNQILKFTKKPISFEVFADETKNIINQALAINKWGKQVYVKVPVINSKKKLKLEIYRIKTCLESLEKRGYIQWQLFPKIDSDLPRGYMLKKISGECSFHIVSGKHRVACMRHLCFHTHGTLLLQQPPQSGIE